MLFLKAFILGFSVSAPVGPIGILCIQRTLSKGKSAGFLTGFGAVTANIIYAAIAAFGFSMVSSFLLKYELYLKIFGSAFLIYLGVKTFLKKPASNAAQLEGETLFRMYASTFLLMITNPAAILNFAAMFTGLGFDKGLDSSFALIGGVFLGASFWWMILSIGVSAFKKRIVPHLSFINKAAGALIVLLGVLAF
ncbi:LysE family transporter [Metabacillus sp. KIGAM252]|uniref:LysE family transporter n=1 Tax=Metabacillus flavus TaxID=2823519 RepID=A0ABS5LAC1_9BACI|nr:LysE family transporter [Metabacillus flavus]MBS2967670.1 LysE family transporter [Metabacillus flavus]